MQSFKIQGLVLLRGVVAVRLPSAEGVLLVVEHVEFKGGARGRRTDRPRRLRD